MPSDYLYTVSETAKILRMNPNAVYDLIKKNLLSATRLGRIKVRKKEIEKFMERIDGKDLSDLDNVKELKL
nr:helix-turn-helix domain-containing protein [Peptoclostridium litorale]